MICDWITIDPISVYLGNELSVGLGYPDLFENMEIPDYRNDDRLIKILKRDNKLIQ